MFFAVRALSVKADCFLGSVYLCKPDRMVNIQCALFISSSCSCQFPGSNAVCNDVCSEGGAIFVVGTASKTCSVA